MGSVSQTPYGRVWEKGPLAPARPGISHPRTPLMAPKILRDRTPLGSVVTAAAPTADSAVL